MRGWEAGIGDRQTGQQAGRQPAASTKPTPSVELAPARCQGHARQTSARPASARVETRPCGRLCTEAHRNFYAPTGRRWQLCSFFFHRVTVTCRPANPSSTPQYHTVVLRIRSTSRDKRVTTRVSRPLRVVPPLRRRGTAGGRIVATSHPAGTNVPRGTPARLRLVPFNTIKRQRRDHLPRKREPQEDDADG